MKCTKCTGKNDRVAALNECQLALKYLLTNKISYESCSNVYILANEADKKVKVESIKTEVKEEKVLDDSSMTNEQLVQRMDKVDKESADVEQQIADLKEKQVGIIFSCWYMFSELHCRSFCILSSKGWTIQSFWGGGGWKILKTTTPPPHHQKFNDLPLVSE